MTAVRFLTSTTALVRVVGGAASGALGDSVELGQDVGSVGRCAVARSGTGRRVARRFG